MYREAVCDLQLRTLPTPASKYQGRVIPPCGQIIACCADTAATQTEFQRGFIKYQILRNI